MNPFRSMTLMVLMFFVQIFISSGYAFSKERDNPLVRRDRPFSIHFLTKDIGWVVGDRGLVFKTADGGESWQSLKMNSRYSFKDITFIDGYGWIVGEEGVILHTNDWGNNWNIQETDAKMSLMCVFFLNKSKGFVVGADGTILATDNGGSSWKTISLDWMGLLPETVLERGICSINLYDIFFVDKSKGWIVGDFGTVLYTFDGGDNWKILQVGQFPHLFSVYFKNSLEGLAIGQNGLFLKTHDGGNKWEKVSLGTEKSLFNIDIMGDYAVVVGDKGTLFQSKDGGETWTKVNLKMRGPYPWLVDVAIVPSLSSGKAIYIGKGIMGIMTIS